MTSNKLSTDNLKSLKIESKNMQSNMPDNKLNTNVSLIKEEKINLPFSEFHNWLQQKSKGYKPCPSHSLFYGLYDYDLRLDGVVLKNLRNKELSSYFEVLNSGYIEAGFSNSFHTPYCCDEQP